MPPAALAPIESEPGTPLVVWRGESSGFLFDEFDMDKTRARSGFFFAEDRHQAEWYAGAGTRARAFHLKASRVLDLRDPTALIKDSSFLTFLANYQAFFDEWVDRGSGEALDVLTAIEAGSLYDYEGDGSGERWHALFRCARNHGYDAVVAPDSTDGSTEPVWVVFAPHQIERAAHFENEPVSRRPRLR